MEPVAHQERLQQMAHQLQEQVRSHLPDLPLQVHCTFKQASLMVLGQHSREYQPETNHVLSVLEAAVQSLPVAWGLALTASASPVATLPVKLFLRQIGEKQPYVTHPFDWHLETVALPTLHDLPTTIEEEEDPDSDAAIAAPPPPTTATAPPAAVSPSQANAAERQPARPVSQPSAAPRPQRPLPWLAIGGAAAAIAVLGTATYALTRPCVLGSCVPVNTAQSLSQTSLQNLQTAKSEADLEPIRQQITETQQTLAQVPSWSPYYGQVQPVRQAIEQVLLAEDKAAAAIAKGQTIPQAASEWQATQSLWQEAIAQMEAVPTESPWHNFAQQRLVTYQTNLEAVKRRLGTEAAAQKSLQTAKETATIAEARAGIIGSSDTPLQALQLARSTWQVAVNQAKAVPPETTSYTEAKGLLDVYQAKLKDIRDRANGEQRSTTAFNQAKQLAQQATTLQQRNQWPEAISTWRNALNAAKNVPQGTSRYAEAQNLVESYTDKLRQTVTLSRARVQLEKVCAGKPRICNYSIPGNEIRVVLTSAYRRALQLAAVTSNAGDLLTREKTMEHLNSLETALQAVCDNAGVPLTLTDSFGETLTTLMPGGGG